MLNLENWYKENIKKYEGLTTVAKTIIEGLLSAEGIEIFSVLHRTKNLDSLKDKFKKKEYSSLDNVTDLSGVRVIAYVESDLKKIREIMEGSFDVVPEKSLDKSEELDEDQVGYRSIHYILGLGENRCKLPELKQYKGMVFELQIRTVLQHAWAEIEHDRSYKLKQALPKHLRRRLYLLSGTLELLDAEFSRVVGDIEDYARESKIKIDKGDLDIEITAEAIVEYLKESHPGISLDFTKFDVSSAATKELELFDIRTLSDLDKALNDKVSSMLREFPASTLNGLVRKLMICIDRDKFFDAAWQRNFIAVTPTTYNMMCKIHGKTDTDHFLKKYNLRVTRGARKDRGADGGKIE